MTESKYCLHCGTNKELIGGVYRCPKCEHYCKICGVLVTPDYNYCINCGEKLKTLPKKGIRKYLDITRKQIKKKYYAIHNDLKRRKEEAIKLSIEKEKVAKEQVGKMWEDAIRLKKLKQYQAAIQELNNAFDINTKNNAEHPNDEITFEIAKLYHLIHDEESSLRFLNISLELDYEEPEVWYQKGVVLLKNALDPKGAKDCFYHTLDLNPIHQDALYYMGFVQAENGNIKDSVETFDKLLKLNKNYENKEYMELFDQLKREKGIKVEKRKRALYCPHCGEKLKKKNGEYTCPVCDEQTKEAEYKQETTINKPTRENTYGGFWIRLLAYLLDSILILFTSIILIILSAGASITSTNPGSIITMISTSIIPSLVIIPYFILLDAYGGTLGKRICGLKVVTEDDKNIGILKAIIRRIMWQISLLILSLGHLWIGLDDKKQGWHDKVAGSYVKKR